MREIRRRSLLIGAAAAVCGAPASVTAANLELPIKIVPSERRYEYGELDGRPIYVATHFRELDAAALERCLSILSASVTRLAAVVPSPAWQKLARIPIWLEFEDPNFPTGCYHESKGWVISNGYEPGKVGAVQFTRNLARVHADQPMALMHELAHAYHHQVLSHDEPSISRAYERAKASGLYDNVRRNNGVIGPAYALGNAREFFAELSEAYFGENDYPPYTRIDLQLSDPESHEVIAAAWNRAT